VLLEQNNEWQLQHPYMQIEGMVDLEHKEIGIELLVIPNKAA
jgi:hypothetical protein